MKARINISPLSSNWRFSRNKPPVLLGEVKGFSKIKTSWYNRDGLATASLKNTRRFLTNEK